MDFFNFEDISIFDTELTVEDGNILDDQYMAEDVTICDTQYDTTYTTDGVDVYDTQVTVDNAAFVDQTTFVDTTVYSDQTIILDAPVHNTEVTVVDTTVYDNQSLISDNQILGTQNSENTLPGIQYDYLITVNDGPTAAYSTPQPALIETAVNNQYVINDPAYPTTQTYSNTTFEASFQAQYGAQPAVTSNAYRPPDARPASAAVQGPRPPTQTNVGNTPTNVPSGPETVAQGGNQALSVTVNPSVSLNVTPTGSTAVRPTASQMTSQHATQGHHAPNLHNGHLNVHGITSRPSNAVASYHNPTASLGGRPPLTYGQDMISNALGSLGTKPNKLPLKMGKVSGALKHGMRLSSQGSSVINMFSSSVKATGNICNSLAQTGTVSSADVGTLTIDALGLAWKAGSYAYHKSNMKKQLALCLLEYCTAGYLELQQDFANPKLTIWKTTTAFHDSNFLLRVYKDIEQYVKLAKISDAEMNALGWRNVVTVYAERKMPDVIQQLSHSCDALGVRNITQTDLETRFNTISFANIGVISLTNAFLIESERRRRREVDDQPPEHHLVPILGRVLSLVAMCGISEMRLSDIALVLGKAPMFETVARSRIAALRRHHASHTLNSLLFGGSTESAVRDFAQEALQFKDQRIAVGRVVAPMTPKFDQPWAKTNCVFSGPVDANQPVGAQIYMLAGWARLVLQREQLPRMQVPAGRPVAQIPTTERDVHGNRTIHAGALGQLIFTVKALADGTLMAKPRRFDQFDFLGSSDYNQGRANTKAMGEEKHFGGLVGPAHCGCVVDDNKGRLTAEWRYSEELGVGSRVTVQNTIQHTKQMTAKKISILWSSGDWAKGVFLMQTLPQSSYLQGRGECLHCAIENAALAGCVEVIACAGGRVTAAARNVTYTPSVLATQTQPNRVMAPNQAGLINPATQIVRPPPCAGATAPTNQQINVNPSPRPVGLGMENRVPVNVTKSTSVRRKPIGANIASANATKKPVIQATMTEIDPATVMTPIEEKRTPSIGSLESGIIVATTTRKVVKVENQVTVAELDEFSVDLC